MRRRGVGQDGLGGRWLFAFDNATNFALLDSFGVQPSVVFSEACTVISFRDVEEGARCKCNTELVALFVSAPSY